MRFDRRSGDAFGQVDIIVNNAGILHVAPLMLWHKDCPAAGRLAAMLTFAGGPLVAEPARRTAASCF
jgi:NAD(P)-dependent dehydrogenase (short-subunit alcohol dehydrogenase family)